MSSDVLERQLEDEHEVRMFSLGSCDPDCKFVIRDASKQIAARRRKTGWSGGERLQRFCDKSRNKTKFVTVYPLDPKGSETGRRRPAYYIDKRGNLYSWYDRIGVLEYVRPEVMDLHERKLLEILLGINLSSAR